MLDYIAVPQPKFDQNKTHQYLVAELEHFKWRQRVRRRLWNGGKWGHVYLKTCKCNLFIYFLFLKRLELIILIFSYKLGGRSFWWGGRSPPFSPSSSAPARTITEAKVEQISLKCVCCRGVFIQHVAKHSPPLSLSKKSASGYFSARCAAACPQDMETNSDLTFSAPRTSVTDS